MYALFTWLPPSLHNKIVGILLHREKSGSSFMLREWQCPWDMDQSGGAGEGHVWCKPAGLFQRSCHSCDQTISYSRAWCGYFWEKRLSAMAHRFSHGNFSSPTNHLIVYIFFFNFKILIVSAVDCCQCFFPPILKFIWWSWGA